MTCSAPSTSLSDNQHQILVLRELEGLSYGEIGERMGMSRPMVESTLFRARRRLTQEYDELASGRRCHEVQAAVDGREARGLGHTGDPRAPPDLPPPAPLPGLPAPRPHGRRRRLRAAGPRPGRRVAALLPFGWLRLRWHRAGAKLAGLGAATARTADAALGLAERPPQSVAVGRAAAAAAALLITGGSITALSRPGHACARRAPGRGGRRIAAPRGLRPAPSTRWPSPYLVTPRPAPSRRVRPPARRLGRRPPWAGTGARRRRPRSDHGRSSVRQRRSRSRGADGSAPPALRAPQRRVSSHGRGAPVGAPSSGQPRHSWARF